MFSTLASHSVYSPACQHPDSDMPTAAQDWKISPWATIDDIFRRQNAASTWETSVDEFFRQRLPDPSVLRSLPSLNSVSTHELADGQIVRFRCMVQDIFDPEFYLSVFQVRDLTTGVVRLGSGKYRDVAPCGPRDELQYDAEVTRNKDRQTLYCVNIPGEAPWVLDRYKQLQMDQAIAGCSKQQNRLKRNLETEDDDAGEVMEASENPTDNKKAKLEVGQVNSGQSNNFNSHSLNLPIPSSKGKACIVKVYDTDASFAVNDCIEFVGIISLDPSLASFPTESDQDFFEQFNQQEKLAKSPPPSLVPRLHVLYFQRLNHSNPTLPQELPISVVQTEVSQCRDELHAILTKALMGDSLCADYLICHLISKIYLRRGGLTLGKFSLNMHQMPLEEKYTKRLSTLIQLLTCKSHYLPLSVENLNKLVFVPKKDYHANRLVSGLLQLSSHTHLIVDETAMANGQLSADGLKNLTALGTVINWQHVEYNFEYHQIEFNSDIPCLVLSEGRSMLPNDCQVMLRPTEPVTPSLINERFAAIGAYLTIPLLERLRKYLTLARHLTFEVTEEVQTAVQEDFVNERQAGSDRMTAEDLHGLLVMSRLLALSNGLETLTPDVWQKVKAMEKERKERVAHLPSRQRPILATGDEPVTMAN